MVFCPAHDLLKAARYLKIMGYLGENVSSKGEVNDASNKPKSRPQESYPTVSGSVVPAAVKHPVKLSLGATLATLPSGTRVVERFERDLEVGKVHFTSWLDAHGYASQG